MKLLVLNQFASTPDYSSGAGERFYFLSKWFAKSGIDTTIVSASYNHLFLHFPNLKGLFTTEKFDGGQMIWVKVKRYKAASSFGRVLNLFEFAGKCFLLPKRITKGVDTVLVSSMSLFPILYAMYLKKRRNVKFILEIRDIWPLTPIQIGGYSHKHPYVWLMKKIARLGYKNADQIVSVLPDFQTFLSEEEGMGLKTYWIPNGIEAKGKIDKGLSFDSQKEEFIIVYTGAIGDANAISFLIEAAMEFDTEDRIIFWLVGDGPNKFKLVEKTLGLDHIKWFDKVPKNDVQKILEQGDCCYHGCRNLSLYRYGISPNKMNDYMLSGKPIISSSPCINDPVILAKAGIHVPAEDKDALIKAILRMREIPLDKRAELGNNGRKYLLEQNTYECLSKSYIRVLNA